MVHRVVSYMYLLTGNINDRDTNQAPEEGVAQARVWCHLRTTNTVVCFLLIDVLECVPQWRCNGLLFWVCSGGLPLVLRWATEGFVPVGYRGIAPVDNHGGANGGTCC